MSTLLTDPKGRRWVMVQRLACALSLTVLAACASRMDGAPVVDRSANSATALSTQPLGPPPPGYYRVKPGDTLYRIAFDNGQNYRDIAGWNNLSNPNQIEVGQLLRVAPPGTTPMAGAPDVSTAPIVGGPIQSTPLGGPANGAPGGSFNNAPGGVAGGAPGGTYSPPSGAPPFVPYAPPASGAVASSTPPFGGPVPPTVPGQISLSWPAHGPILNTFDENQNKGVNIGGNAGDPVTAAADGRVVYAGSGLRGYGNLIIIKHDSTFLTAYAHNRALMVKEGDAVTRGQKIAEMGNSDSDRVMLHFELRKQGKPVDPSRYLAPR